MKKSTTKKPIHPLPSQAQEGVFSAKRIKTVEMTRRIRDANYEKLIGKTPDERIMFYREKAQRLHREFLSLSQASPEINARAKSQSNLKPAK